MLNGRYLKNELSQYLFNKTVEKNYIESLRSDSPQLPPRILIEIFLKSENYSLLASLAGNGNSEKIDECGISFCIEFDEQYLPEYKELEDIKTIPIEYYRISWKSFARELITTRSIPIKSALIDSTNTRLQNGSDLYVSRIIKENLEDKEKVQISQAHRKMKESFMEIPSINDINSKISKSADITGKQVKISVDLSTQNAWEMSLMTYLDDIPFHYVGKGEQCIVKTNLALSHKKSQEANVILLEEPENHLSHSKLNALVKKIITRLENKQMILSTHSSYIANKLGLGNLIFLNYQDSMMLHHLSVTTRDFFSKLAGYDTLRLILCKKAILVEGASDELIVQKAYMVHNNGKLPIEDEIDIISVGTSFLRFLEIAEKINKKIVVVTDNDGDISAIKNKYENYIDGNSKDNIKICFDEIIDSGDMTDFNYNTLEPKILKENGKDMLNKILGTTHDTDEKLLKYMCSKKTDCALLIFDTEEKITFPKYILDSIK